MVLSREEARMTIQPLPCPLPELNWKPVAKAAWKSIPYGQLSRARGQGRRRHRADAGDRNKELRTWRAGESVNVEVLKMRSHSGGKEGKKPHSQERMPKETRGKGRCQDN